MPSGSVLNILTKFEVIARSQRFMKTSQRGIMLKMMDQCKVALQGVDLFPGHEEHKEELLNIVLQKFTKLRIRKALQDDNTVQGGKSGNYIHRSRIFQGK